MRPGLCARETRLANTVARPHVRARPVVHTGVPAGRSEAGGGVAAAGEALPPNNSQVFTLKVIRDRVRVLHVCGRPSWDQRFLRSMEMDLTVDRYETFDDLLVYMDGSAAVIGEMMVPILEPLQPEAFQHARELGNAFQLSNFWRDVNEDLDRGRVYIPQEDLRKFGADPWLRKVTPEWRELMAFEIARTREIYASADLGIPMLPPASARCIRGARALYSGILTEIEKAGYDVFTSRVRVPTWKKLAVAFRMLRP